MSNTILANAGTRKLFEELAQRLDTAFADATTDKQPSEMSVLRLAKANLKVARAQWDVAVALEATRPENQQ